jgi:sulfate transport system permease protein
VFVTFPFVARELIPLMQAQGKRRGEAARAGRQRLADVLARHAAQHQVGPALRRDPVQRARDGRVRRGVGGVRPHPRQTNTMPLHVEILYNEYQFAARSPWPRCWRCWRWSRWSLKTWSSMR